MTLYIDFLFVLRQVFMRIYCKCGEKARISSRDQIALSFTRLYCQCLDVKGCGHRFVMTLAYSHTLAPEAEAAHKLLHERLYALPLQRQREIFEELGISST